MYGFSTVDGFVELNECLAEMIKYIANEPSVGLYYVQQHTQNAVPNVLNLKNHVLEKSRETTLHSEDMEDSITMVRSMKECGFPIADEMINDIRRSLSIISTKQPRRGLIRNHQTSSFGSSSSWRYPGNYQTKEGYFSTVFKSAKQKANIFTKEVIVPNDNESESQPDSELAVSSRAADEIGQIEGNGVECHESLILGTGLQENYEEFKANKEAELEEWLKSSGEA